MKGLSYYNMFYIFFKDTNFDFDKMIFRSTPNIIFVDAFYIPEDETCPICGSTALYKNGFKSKTVKHCTYYMILFKVKCHIQGYKCKSCNCYFYEKDTFSNPGESISKESVFAILDKLKYANATFESVAKDMHLKRQNIIDIFDKYVDYTVSSTLPKIMSWDEKHINKSLTDHAYSFVILDWKNIKIYDMLPSRHKIALEKYFSSFSKEQRDKVEYITIDMWESYKDVAKRYFKNAKIAIDSFDVMKLVNNAINKIRISVMQKYNLHTDNILDNDPYYYALKTFSYYLTMEFDDINPKRFYNKKLKMYLDKYSLLKYILDIDDNLNKAYQLVSEYREFNKTTKYENAEQELTELINNFFISKLEPLVDVAKTLLTWKEYIINSFIRINDVLDKDDSPRRLSNGPIEGINSIIEKINVNGNGYTNFKRFKNRCIYVINKEYIIKGNPKK